MISLSELKKLNVKKDLLPLAKSYAPWAVFVILPLLINVLIWKILVSPPESALRQIRETEALVRLRTELGTFVENSRAQLNKREKDNRIVNNATVAVQEIKKLADVYNVVVGQLNVEDKKSGGNLSTFGTPAGNAPLGQVLVDLEVTGPFQKILGWLNAIESRPGFQTGRCVLTRSSERESEDFMSIGIDVLLVNS